MKRDEVKKKELVLKARAMHLDVPCHSLSIHKSSEAITYAIIKL